MANNVSEYFTPAQIKDEKSTHSGKVLLGVAALGIVVAIIGYLTDATILYFIGEIWILVFIVLGIVKLNKSEVQYMSGTEYDEMVERILKSKNINPKEYLGLDDSEVTEIEPVSFEGYKFSEATRVRQDPTDYIWRSNLYEQVTIYFTQNEIHMHKLKMETYSQQVTETSDVLFYDDVVSISTKSESEVIGRDKVDYISFNLVSKGGNSLSVALMGTDNRQRSINAMRALIKEKKTGN